MLTKRVTDPKKILEIEQIIEDIQACLATRTYETGSGLYSGLTGQLLFQWQLKKYKASFVDEGNFSALLEKVQLESQTQQDISLAWGLSGYSWFLELLLSELEDQPYDPEVNRDFEGYLLHQLSASQWNGDNEVVLGLAGISVFARRRFANNGGGFLYPKVIKTLLEQSVQTPQGLSWSTPVHSVFRVDKQAATEFNLGLAHGVASSIVTLTHALPVLEEQLPQIKGALESSIDWLLSQKNQPECISCFGYRAGQEANTRLAWCYGDVSTALTLVKAALQLNNQELLSQAKTIAIASTNRRAGEAGVEDAGICHGSAGLYLIYLRLWELLQVPELLEAAHYWLDQTLMFYREKGLAGFDSYVPEENAFISQPGLLEGYSGIGLCLLVALGIDEGWDDCLLLS
ncbi:hypothetical protein MHO82_14245 [Vibrio sp. Of7-15]|uniref:lanthionine synthetase LanC family protein n=1 Tax=Vibrio sp. Of7-15 TaxID=2724879 RepID=UPI001EF2F172|nr:lanthionine synthetase LanC family protein [Vibrio sp. Of7-15]MCG7498027.1 hypothetical protein [Vibrio sp. Of7-15]